MMNITNRLLASSALIISVAATPLHAANLRPSTQGFITQTNTLPIVRVQMKVSDAQARLEAAMAALAKAQSGDGDVAAATAEVNAAQSALEAAIAAEAEAAAPVPAPVEEQPAVEEAPVEAAPAEKPVAEEAPAEAAPAEKPAAEEAPVEAAPAEKPVAEEAPSEAVPTEKPAAEEAPAEAVPTEKPVAEEAPAEAVPTEKPAAEEAPAEAVPTEKPAAEEAPAEPAAEAAPAEQPAAEEPAATEESAAPAEKQSAAEQDAKAEATAKATAESKTEVTPEAMLPVENGAPVLDSAKEAPAKTDKKAKAPAAPVDAQPAPTDDANAQASVVKIEEIPASLAEEGQRLEAAPTRQRQKSEQGEVVKESNNRFIIQFNNQITIENNDRERIRQRAEDVYYEELPRGRTREVITRRNGVRIITVRNRYGEIIRRSKILRNGEEIILAYVPENSREDRRSWSDTGRDLPPLRLTIPLGDYVLDATVARPGQFYEFLEQPPVERVERIYSVDEVKHSARIRDKVRRIEMDTLTFETGSAKIARDQITNLAKLADAMDKILADNPGETFLIEGHTDAVGSEESNLILSDERAESVAIALSSVYGIPPENLATQGYGERYLKVRTEAAERLNRRVTIRRITALVTPVAAR